MNWEQLLSSHKPGSKSSATRAERSEFEVDYDRIIFSLPFRRLQDKTQVFPLPEDDFVHNRLTHSLEVASVGRSLGKQAGEKILSKHRSLAKSFSAADFGAIVSAASLAHDVGNPPFGHSGENAISGYFKNPPPGMALKERVTKEEWTDLTNFEGNAQGFRLINQTLHGLRLSAATLGAFTKYPHQSMVEHRATGKVSQKKYGYFQSEKDVFCKLASTLGLLEREEGRSWARHPLAFLVEAADDICYHIIDLEDGCTLGLLSLTETIDLLKPILGETFNQQKLDARATRHEKLGTLRALAINILIGQVVDHFVEKEEDVLVGDFDAALIEGIDASAALAAIKQVSINRIYRSRVVLEKELAGFEVMEGLLSTLVQAIIEFTDNKELLRTKTLLRLLPEELTMALSRNELYSNLRVTLDYISGMTDSHALAMYRRIKGMSLPSW